MRPTFLQFRSPKERTGEFLSPTMTPSGKSLLFSPREVAKSYFPKGQRWEHIREISCRTAATVGPGCYNSPMSTNRGRSVKMVKPNANVSENFDYIYVGDALIKRERPQSKMSKCSTTTTLESSRGFLNDKSSSSSSTRLLNDSPTSPKSNIPKSPRSEKKVFKIKTHREYYAESPSPKSSRLETLEKLLANQRHLLKQAESSPYFERPSQAKKKIGNPTSKLERIYL